MQWLQFICSISDSTFHASREIDEENSDECCIEYGLTVEQSDSLYELEIISILDDVVFNEEEPDTRYEQFIDLQWLVHYPTS